MPAEGDYEATILGGWIGPDYKGLDAVHIDFQIDTPPRDVGTWRGSLQGSWLESTTRTLRNVGLPDNDLARLDTLTQKKITVSVKKTPNKKKPGQFYTNYFISGPRIKYDAATTAQLADRYKRAMAAVDAPEPSDADDGPEPPVEPPPPRRQSNLLPVDDDDIRF